jgi:hypothetical protein
MHGRASTRHIKQVSVGYEEIPNRERHKQALLLLHVESWGKQKAVLNTDIKRSRKCNVLGADFAESVCVKVTFISILLTFSTLATAATSTGLCYGVIIRFCSSTVFVAVLL